MSLSQILPEEILTHLVGFDTVSSKSNLALISYVEDFLIKHGVSSARVTNSGGDKAALFATLGPKEVGGIALSAHTDTVPVEGQLWLTNPFCLTAKERRLYGRGSCDMKGFLACVLSLVPDFQSADLKIPIHLIFSYDEEVGCTGVRPLIARFGDEFVKPRIVIVGEPTSMKVVDGHKSINGFVTEITGKEAHSSVPDLGVNAIQVAGRYLRKLGEYGDHLQVSVCNDRFTPAYSTLHVGKIEGGTALNIVPKKCRLVWEQRGLPRIDEYHIPRQMEEYAQNILLPGMRAVFEGANIDTRRVNQVPAFSAAENSEAVTLALQLAGQNERLAVSYGTEAGLFEQAGCPTVICGPGSIEQAHKPDEFISQNELDECLRFLRALKEYASI